MLTISAQQASFYTQNGFLELQGAFSPSECQALQEAIGQTLSKRGQPDNKPNALETRDLWRDHPLLKTTLLSKKLTTLVLACSRKTTLRLAFDHWFFPGFSLPTPEKIEHLFSIQGLVCAVFIQLNSGHAKPVAKTASLGLFPFPQEQGAVLLVKPSLLLNWPQVTPEMGLYCVGFCLPSSVYVQNPKDHAGGSLRKWNYGYGDPLRADTHPLIHT